MFFVILFLSFQGLAFFIAGGTLSSILIMETPISDILLSLLFALFVWLLGKGLSALLGGVPSTFKCLNTRKKRIVAAIIIFIVGFILDVRHGKAKLYTRVFLINS